MSIMDTVGGVMSIMEGHVNNWILLVEVMTAIMEVMCDIVISLVMKALRVQQQQLATLGACHHDRGMLQSLYLTK